ncbi:MAG: 4Fe-4S dicluster domain-containing protein, partial [Myxococcales bacterium]|nr:4Fe-4S dicluster domain-containing protein [Myxococcales bacterium]
CRACEDACPPGAILPAKQLARGEVRWYVDFDRCLPFFNEHQGCAICLAACPWNHPGVAGTLVHKLAARRARCPR